MKGKKHDEVHINELEHYNDSNFSIYNESIGWDRDKWLTKPREIELPEVIPTPFHYNRLSHKKPYDYLDHYYETTLNPDALQVFLNRFKD